MRYFLLALFPVVSIYLQTTLFQHIKIDGVLPDLVLVFVVFFALLNGGIRGGIYGVCCGMLEDIYLGGVLGINILCKGLIGYLMGKMYKQMNPESFWLGPIGVLIGGIFNAVLFSFFMLTFHLYTMNLERIFIVFFIQILYQVIISIPISLWYYHSHAKGWLKPAEEEDRLWNRINRLVK